MHLVKYINHFTNERVTVKEKARQIVQYLLLLEETEESILVMNEVEIQFKAEMMKRKETASAVCRAVNSKWESEPMKLERKPYVYDPNYDKSLAELEVQY